MRTLADSKLFQEQDARTPERKLLSEFLDDDRKAEKFDII